MGGRVILHGPGIRAWGCLFIILSLLLLATCGRENNFGLGDAVGSGGNNLPGRIAVLYFDGSTGSSYALGREIRRLPGLEYTSGGQDKNDMLALLRGNLEELIKGPEPGSPLAPTIPAGTKLLHLEFDKGIARVVFSKELALGHWGGSRREELTVYSITNTLTGIPWVEGVRIEIEGEGRRTVAGHLSLDQVFFYKQDLVK
ncbi:MAG: GerMN domain-containing protein [bacterium]|jgi:spore germination protein GerM